MLVINIIQRSYSWRWIWIKSNCSDLSVNSFGSIIVDNCVVNVPAPPDCLHFCTISQYFSFSSCSRTSLSQMGLYPSHVDTMHNSGTHIRIYWTKYCGNYWDWGLYRNDTRTSPWTPPYHLQQTSNAHWVFTGEPSCNLHSICKYFYCCNFLIIFTSLN